MNAKLFWFEEDITEFNGEFAFLSNFYPCEIEYEGITYPTVEHAYQAAKSLDKEVHKKIAKLKYPGQAKKAGRHLHIRSDWEDVKVKIMEYLLMKKFAGYHELSEKLYDTGERYLEEGNNWGDTFWGVCSGKGRNMLGLLLMSVREKIKPLYDK